MGSFYTGGVANGKKAGIKLFRFLISKFRNSFALILFITFTDVCIVRILQFTFFWHLLNSCSGNYMDDRFFYTTLVICTSLAHVVLQNAALFQINQLRSQIKLTISSIVYQKTLRVSTSVRERFSLGNILNLISSDLNCLSGLMPVIRAIFCPLYIIILGAMLWSEIGVYVLLGLGVLAIALALQMRITCKLLKLESKLAQAGDMRISILSETITSLKLIKIQVWEDFFQKRIHKRRAFEDSVRMQKLRWEIGYQLIGTLLEIFILCLTLLIWVFSNSKIRIHFTLAMIGRIASCMTTELPYAVKAFGDICSVFSRVEEYLNLPEKRETQLKPQNNNNVQHYSQNFPEILMKAISVGWGSNLKILHSISGCISANDHLTVLVGSSGSGKTTLLETFLSELSTSFGKLRISGTVSYASQKPWFFTGSIRENIVTGKTYMSARYERVLSVCQLKYDLEQLPEGDLTILVGNGQNLSGGQKARINLARAVYQDADIYILDDVLVSVDAHCGQRIFHECIQQFLKDKLVLLVSNDATIVAQADKILMLDQGQVKFIKTDVNNIANIMDIENNASLDISVSNDKHKVDDIEDDIRKYAPATGTKGRKAKGSLVSQIWKFISSTGKHGFIFVFILSLIILKYLEIRCDTWLYSWTDSNFQTRSGWTDAIISLALYSLLVISCTLLTYAMCYRFTLFTTEVVTNFHDRMVNSILSAPVDFLHYSDQASPLQVLTEDVKTLDDDLSKGILGSLNSILELVCVFYLVSWLSPIIAVSTITILLGLIWSKRTEEDSETEPEQSDLAGSKQTDKNPILSFLENTIEGVVTIRASQSAEFMAQKFEKILANASRHGMEYMTRQRWFAFRCDFVCWAYISLTSYALLYFADETDTGRLEIVLIRIFALNYVLRWSLQAATELGIHATAIQRCIEICSIQPEIGTAADFKFKKPVSNKACKIEFRDVIVKFGSNEKQHQVLNEVSLTINSGESVGIVGRTGAGKSTLVSTALNMAPLTSGSILIDDVSIDEMDPRELRRRVSTISQDALVFSGTLRSNIDPLRQFSEHKLTDAFTQLEIINMLPELNFLVAEGGRNLSAGQKQLIALTRVYLRRCGVVFLDEPIAHVDRRTWNVIRRAFQKHFKNCTVLSIAHGNSFILKPKRLVRLKDGKLQNECF